MPIPERTFFLLTIKDIEIDGVSFEVSTCKQIDNIHCYLNLQLPEIQEFCATAEPGNIFQVQLNEYILVFGKMVCASWLQG
jgi:hypothetical protein